MAEVKWVQRREPAESNRAAGQDCTDPEDRWVVEEFGDTCRLAAMGGGTWSGAAEAIG
jgi:hypothetical protein